MVADDPILGGASRDPRALARELGGDAVAALVGAVLKERREGAHSREPLIDAARRLAAPEPAAPKWPERVWAHFERRTGKWLCVTDDAIDVVDGYDKALPARLVPLDGSAVVLTRGVAVVARNALLLLGLTESERAITAAIAAASAEGGR